MQEKQRLATAEYRRAPGEVAKALPDQVRDSGFGTREELCRMLNSGWVSPLVCLGSIL